jgi:Spy/CpxP family protein refolding chaperone
MSRRRANGSLTLTLSPRRLSENRLTARQVGTSSFEKGGLRGIFLNDQNRNPPWPPFSKGGGRGAPENRQPPRAVLGEEKPRTVPRKADKCLFLSDIETILRAVFIAVVWLCAPARSALAGGAPTPSPALSPAPETTRTPEEDARTRSRLQRVTRAWWHEPQLVTALELTDEQRAKMDEILGRRMETRHQLLAGYRAADAEFQKALGEGDWSAARRHMSDMRERAAAEAESRANLRLEVFEVLNADQRRTLVEKHSNVVTRPWLPGYGPRRSMATRARTPQEGPPERP